MIKVLAPNMACQVIDWAIQAHGGGGVTDQFGLSYAYAQARTLRLADGPDEVHRNAIGKMELGRYVSKDVYSQLMANPELILMDEPSEGLSPKLVQRVGEIMQALRAHGHAVLLVEQNFALAMAVADYIYVVSAGRFVFEGTPQALNGNPEILDQHLGVAQAH